MLIGKLPFYSKTKIVLNYKRNIEHDFLYKKIYVLRIVDEFWDRKVNEKKKTANYNLDSD